MTYGSTVVVTWRSGDSWSSPARNPGCSQPRFALPQQHAYGAPDGGTEQKRTPLGHLRTVLDELVDAGVLQRRRRDGIDTASGSRCTGWQYSPGKNPCASSPMPLASTSRNSPSPSSTRAWHEPVHQQTFHETRGAYNRDDSPGRPGRSRGAGGRLPAGLESAATP
jgi:hypothetical protein